MSYLTKIYLACILTLARMDEWLMKRNFVRLICWIAFAGSVNTYLVLPLIKRWLDPVPSFWLEMGIMIPLNMSMMFFWDAFHLWFWQATNRFVNKHVAPKAKIELKEEQE